MLFDQTNQADIDLELKTFILDGLHSIQRGIFEYRIRGRQRLRETLGEIVGSIAVNRDVIERAGENKTLGQFEKLFCRFAAVVSFAADATALLSAAKISLLPSGG